MRFILAIFIIGNQTMLLHFAGRSFLRARLSQVAVPVEQEGTAQMSALPGRPRNRELPMSAVQFREHLWSLAGVDLQARAAALREAFETSRALLKAEKSELVSFQGDYVEVSVPDNAARSRAVDQMFSINGVEVGKQELSQGSSGPVTIVINAPYFQPEPSPVLTPTLAITEAPPSPTTEQGQDGAG